MTDETISQRLAAWGAALEPARLPPATAATARNILVDVVGLCVAARDTDYVTAVRGAAEPGEHVLVGHRDRASATGAALVNGTAAHGEDFDDTFEGGPIHSGAVVVPAVLAAAKTYGLSSDRILLGLCAGTELMCRLALTVPKAVHKAGFHPTAVLGAFGAAFAVAVASRQDPKVTANALGIVGSLASGIIEYLGDGSWTKRMHPGWAAQSGLTAVALARNGFVGPRAVFEGTHGAFAAFAPSITPRTERLWDGLGEVWTMDAVTFKPYPCGTMVQPYIDCAIALRERGVPVEGISAILAMTADGIVHRLWEPLDQKRRPPTAYAAKFSTPYGIALGLVRGHADLGDFTDEALADPTLQRIAALVGYEVDPQNPYPDAFTGHVRLTYEDGRVEEASQGYMRGGSAAPLSRDEIDAKFRANVRYGRHDAPDRLLGVCDAIGAMEGDHRMIEELGA